MNISSFFKVCANSTVKYFAILASIGALSFISNLLIKPAAAEQTVKWQSMNDELAFRDQKSWATAQAYCKKQGWRLPTIDEFGVVARKCGGLVTTMAEDVNRKFGDPKSFQNDGNRRYINCIKSFGFPMMKYYWTSQEDDQMYAWNFDFERGGAWSGDKERGFLARCVKQ